MLLDMLLRPLPFDVVHISSDEMIYQWSIFFFSFSSLHYPKKYMLVLFIVDISTFIFIILIFNFNLDHFIYVLFFLI